MLLKLRVQFIFHLKKPIYYYYILGKEKETSSKILLLLKRRTKIEKQDTYYKILK